MPLNLRWWASWWRTVELPVVWGRLILQTGTLTEDGLDVWGVMEGGPAGFSELVREPRHLPHGHMLSGLACCHTVALMRGQPLGDPLELKMVESTGWVGHLVKWNQYSILLFNFVLFIYFIYAFVLLYGVWDLNSMIKNKITFITQAKTFPFVNLILLIFYGKSKQSLEHKKNNFGKIQYSLSRGLFAKQVTVSVHRNVPFHCWLIVQVCCNM